jgi:hypothetical protein
MLTELEQKAARQLADMAVDAHNSRPGCPDPKCSVCAANRRKAERVIETCKVLGVEVRFSSCDRYLHVPENA